MPWARRRRLLTRTVQPEAVVAERPKKEAAPAGGSGGIGDGMSDMECWSC